MRTFSTFALLTILVLWSSCRSDFETVESTGNLEFSRDTIFLDTVFSNLSSATHTLKVYNHSQEDIHIPEITLGRGESSAYRLNVDGQPGKTFRDVEILANDSIYIFIETTVPFSEKDQKEFLHQDVIQFQSSGHLQEVPVLTLVKDAILLFPEKNSAGITQTIPIGKDEQGEDISVTGFYLGDTNLSFTNEQAYVIYGYAVVPSGKTLTIHPGARIYFHANSGIIVSDGATLQVNGSPSDNLENPLNEVVFQADRLGEEFQEVPGQWGTIWLQKGSRNNTFNYATIRNATVGILAEGNSDPTPLLHIANTQIYNSAVNGFRGVSARVGAENLVISNSGQASVHLTGGSYTFKHCTLTNFWGEGFRLFPTVLLENEITTATNVRTVDLDQALFSNCIIYGNERQELGFNRNEGAVFNFEFQNCLIRFEENTASSGNPMVDFSNTSYYQEVILNQNPFFWNPGNNDFRLQAGSPAIDAGNISTANQVPFDLLQESRIPDPDLGAYEWQASTD